MLSRWAAFPDSTQGLSGGLSMVTEACVRGEYDEYGWVVCGGQAPLSWWFSAGGVSSSTRSVWSSFTGWVKISMGWLLSLIFVYALVNLLEL